MALNTGFEIFTDPDPDQVVQDEVGRFAVIFEQQHVAVPVNPAFQITVYKKVHTQPIFETMVLVFRDAIKIGDLPAVKYPLIQDIGEFTGSQANTDDEARGRAR